MAYNWHKKLTTFVKIAAGQKIMHKIRTFLKKLGGESLAALLAVVCLLACIWSSSRLFERPDNFVYDIFMRAQAPKPVHQVPVIIDIDEKSLAEHGQWPWPRYLMADLVRKLCANGVMAIGIDILMADPDRSSLARIRDELAKRFDVQLDLTGLPDKLLDNDAMFAQALREYPVVIATQIADARVAKLPRSPKVVEKVSSGGLSPLESIIRTNGLVLPLPAFADVAPVGIITALPGSDGVIRKIPLLVRIEDNIYANLGLRTLMRAMNKDTLRLRSGKDGLESLGFGKIEHDIGHDGLFMPLYRGKGRSYPYYSATDVLQGRIGPDLLAGRVAFVGTSAASLLDIRNTPTDPVMPGVEVHATIVDNLLTGQGIRRPDWEKGGQVMLALVAGVLAILCFSLAPAITYLPLTIAMLTAGVWSSWRLFEDQIFFSPVPLALAIVMCAVIILPLRFWRVEKGRREIRQAFSRYVAPDVVTRIVERGGKPLAGQQKEMTILFTDVRGFTSLSENLDPGQVVALLNSYFTPMTACVKAREGTMDKFIGDALMAFWNAPLDVEKHAVKAVDAGLAMQKELDRLRPLFLRDFGVEINMGIGINTGMVHVGNMGSEELLDYTSIGDNVNLASRLEGLCKRYGVGIVISATTANACAGEYRFRQLDRIRVKGKNLAVDIFTPIDKTDVNQSHEEMWSEALGLYLGGEFARASRLFADLGSSSPAMDVACQLYLDRCKIMIASPPEHWDGVWTYDSK